MGCQRAVWGSVRMWGISWAVQDQPGVGCQWAVALALSLLWWPWPCVNRTPAELQEP